MEDSRRRQLESSKEEEEFSSSMLENDQSWNTAVANVCATHGFENTTPPLDSQNSHALSVSSSHSFQRGFSSAGTSTTSGGHQFDVESKMTSGNNRATGSADSLWEHTDMDISHLRQHTPRGMASLVNRGRVRRASTRQPMQMELVQVVSPQFQGAMFRPETPMHVHQPASSMRSPMTQQTIAGPSSSIRGHPIRPLHISIPESIATVPCSLSLPEIPMHGSRPAPIVRFPMTQQPVPGSSSSTRRPPIRQLHVSIPPNIPEPRGMYRPSDAPEPERFKTSPAIFFKSQQGLDQPLRYKCGICKRDVSHAPEGPISVPTAPLPVSVLPCGHTFHDQCLQAIIPKEQEQDPPCLPCATGED